jgi:hypothetical protein
MNLSDRRVSAEIGECRVLLGTRREMDGELVDRSVRLDPWEAMILSAPER